MKEEDIVNYCKNNLHKFANMNDMEIYDWLCNNYACKDYEMIRRCSFIIYKDSRNV